MNRRAFLGTTAAFGLAKLAAQNSVPEAIKNLRPMTAGIQPITGDERRARVAKARRLMREHKLGAILMEGGTSLFYFTGTRGLGDDRNFAWVLPAAGEPAWFMAQADEGHVNGIPMHADVRLWKENEDPYKTVAQFLKERGGGVVGLEERARFAVFEGLRAADPCSNSPARTR